MHYYFTFILKKNIYEIQSTIKEIMNNLMILFHKSGIETIFNDQKNPKFLTLN